MKPYFLLVIVIMWLLVACSDKTQQYQKCKELLEEERIGASKRGQNSYQATGYQECMKRYYEFNEY